MSTVVRLAGYPAEEASFFVDWEQLSPQRAQFTLPRNHPLSNYLVELSSGYQPVLIVASTDEVEWHVDKWECNPDRVRVQCIARSLLMKTCVLPDEWLLNMGMVA